MSLVSRVCGGNIISYSFKNYILSSEVVLFYHLMHCIAGPVTSVELLTQDVKTKQLTLHSEDNLTLIENQTDKLVICDVNMTNTLPETTIELMDTHGNKVNITDSFDVYPIFSSSVSKYGGLVTTNQTLRFTSRTNLARFENNGKILRCYTKLKFYPMQIADTRLNIVCKYICHAD